MKQKSVSIIMPALNEEGNIQDAINNVVGAVNKHFADYELIVINDGSTDRTLEIVEQNIRENPKIRVVSNPQPRNIGACYDMGRREAKMDCCIMIQGDNPFSQETISEFFTHAGEADFICSYWNNPQIRSWGRRICSSGYTAVLNWMFGWKIHYYNGMQLHETAWLKTIPLQSVGFGYQAEVLIRALKAGKSRVEVPVTCLERLGGGATKALRLRNIVSVLKTLCLLYKLRK
jgi:dolichol-phosphate mannosyltransferase